MCRSMLVFLCPTVYILTAESTYLVLNLEQHSVEVDNLLCAQANSAFYPEWISRQQLTSYDVNAQSGMHNGPR